MLKEIFKRGNQKEVKEIKNDDEFIGLGYKRRHIFTRKIKIVP